MPGSVRPGTKLAWFLRCSSFLLTAQEGRLSANPGLFPHEQNQYPRVSFSGVNVVVCAMAFCIYRNDGDLVFSTRVPGTTAFRDFAGAIRCVCVLRSYGQFELACLATPQVYSVPSNHRFPAP